LGRQAFYRATGKNSGIKGRWLPFDELVPQMGSYVNKSAYIEGVEGTPLERFGRPELKSISEQLGAMDLPQGGELQDAQHVNEILDFFGARTTRYNFNRPTLE
jgi:hypothetical protein